MQILVVSVHLSISTDVHGKTTSDIQVTYEYIRVTY